MPRMQTGAYQLHWSHPDSGIGGWGQMAKTGIGCVRGHAEGRHVFILGGAIERQRQQDPEAGAAIARDPARAGLRKEIRLPAAPTGFGHDEDDSLARNKSQGALQRQLQQRRTAVERTVLLGRGDTVRVGSQRAEPSAIATGQNNNPKSPLLSAHVGAATSS
jgi:hypothetical protein